MNLVISTSLPDCTHVVVVDTRAWGDVEVNTGAWSGVVTTILSIAEVV